MEFQSPEFRREMAEARMRELRADAARPWIWPVRLAAWLVTRVASAATRLVRRRGRPPAPTASAAASPASYPALSPASYDETARRMTL